MMAERMVVMMAEKKAEMTVAVTVDVMAVQMVLKTVG